MITFLEEEDEAIVVLRVLGVLEEDDDLTEDKQSEIQKASKQACFLLKSENRNNGDERKCWTITFTGLDLAKTQELSKIEEFVSWFFLECVRFLCEREVKSLKFQKK